jgi:ribosomal-protein-alanine N-acetyltransferase
VSPELETERLLLRRWRDDDRAPFAALNRDPEVVEFLTGALTREASDAMIDRIEAHFDERGYGLWAGEPREGGPCVGFVGLWTPNFEAHFTPAVEVGWRLARSAWGHGYASEGARAALRFGFEDAGLSEIVSFTVPANTRSRSVMERIGLHRDPADDFDHPKLAEGHPLRRHVLYRLAADEWREQSRDRAG